MEKQHSYRAEINWTGNNGTGTSNYKAYERSHTVSISGKPEISGSSDPSFRGDASKHNPEDMLVSAIAACHMLYYLHLCAVAGVVVTAYKDRATGIMVETGDGGGHFTEVTLNPQVTVTDQKMIPRAMDLHKKANQCCFIANSLNFPVQHHPVINVENE